MRPVVASDPNASSTPSPLPRLVNALGYAGLLPFVAGPLWWTLAPATVPAWLDPMWRSYTAMIASFMAGSLWGLALPAAAQTGGQLQYRPVPLALPLALTAASTLLMLIAWAALAMPFRPSLLVLAVVFALLLAADVWRERRLMALPAYFTLRVALTGGVLACIVWRLLLVP